MVAPKISNTANCSGEFRNTHSAELATHLACYSDAHLLLSANVNINIRKKKKNWFCEMRVKMTTIPHWRRFNVTRFILRPAIHLSVQFRADTQMLEEVRTTDLEPSVLSSPILYPRHHVYINNRRLIVVFRQVAYS